MGTVSRVHKIWLAEGKRSSDQISWLCHVVCLNFGEFLCLGSENSDFALFSHFCFFNNFLLKSQSKVPFVFGRPLKCVVYDFAFNSIFLFFGKIRYFTT